MIIMCEHKFYDLYGQFNKEKFMVFWRAYSLSERCLINMPRNFDPFIDRNNSRFEFRM